MTCIYQNFANEHVIYMIFKRNTHVGFNFLIAINYLS